MSDSALATCDALIRDELASAAKPCITCSFQIDGIVLLHRIRQVQPDIPVLFLDTFHHFPDVLAYRDRLTRDWALNLVVLSAHEPAIGLWRTSVDECCARHKVDPLFTALEAYDLWFTGLRRDQSPSRAGLGHQASFRLPSGRSLRKVSPLAHWTRDDILDYARRHGLPPLPLYERGYMSIGCEPCTSRPRHPSDPRSGRWAGRRLECGIHVPADLPSHGS
jgi:phosphoadenosine phosphosulfate reductase